MAQGYSAETVGVLDGTLNPPGKLDGRVVNAKVRTARAVLDLSKATVALNSGDTNVLFRLPRGARPIKFLITSSVTLGTTTISIGNAGTPAKYKAAGTFTAVDTPTSFMKASAAANDPLTDYEDVIMTNATANLPNVGIVVVECLYSAR